MENIDVKVLLFDEINRLILLVLEKEKIINLPNGKSFTKPSRWGMPGGRSEPIDKDEIDTAQREVGHEIGIFPDVNVRIRAERWEEDHLKVAFIGYPTSRTIEIDPKEILKAEWFPQRVVYDLGFPMYGTQRAMMKELLRKTRRR